MMNKERVENFGREVIKLSERRGLVLKKSPQTGLNNSVKSKNRYAAIHLVGSASSRSYT